MKIKEIIRVIETHAPLAYAEEWDNTGLLIGNTEQEVNTALIALELTEAVLQEAVDNHCDLVITHHPLIFKGIKKISSNDPIGRMIQCAIARNIAVYAAHTNLDNAPGGVNAVLARKIGLEATSSLLPQSHQLLKLVTFVPIAHAEKVRNALFSAGAGAMGNYDSCCFYTEGTGTFRANNQANPFVGEKEKHHLEQEIRIETVLPKYLRNQVISALIETHPYEEPAYDIYMLENELRTTGSGLIGLLPKALDETEFLKILKEVLNIPMLRHSELTGRNVQKVALCGGSGSFLLPCALAQKADVFITADLKYHDFFMPDKKMLLIDAGHYETEQFTTSLLLDILNKNFSTFAVQISRFCTNAVNYLI